MSLRDRVRDALKRAKVNGYDMANMSPSEIACDLLDYDSDLENEDFSELVSAIKTIHLHDNGD